MTGIHLAWAIFGFVLMLCSGLVLGWEWRGRREVKRLEAAILQAIKTDKTLISSIVEQRQATPEEIEKFAAQAKAPIFQSSEGIAVPGRRVWDERQGNRTIPYEELEGMFLDQFLLRFFHYLMPLPGEIGSQRFVELLMKAPGLSPWNGFIQQHPWAKNMPVLFEQMTGYRLNDMQLNNAIAEYARRLLKTQPAPAT